MTTPLGHTLVGVALARRLGVRSPLGLAAAGVAASLPDFDVFAGMALHRDPWKLHRKATHTPGFALTVGMASGLVGLVSAGNIEGERDLLMDASVGALIVGSHIVLDRLPLPTFERRVASPKKLLGVSVYRWVMDAVLFAPVAWALWPRSRQEPGDP